MERLPAEVQKFLSGNNLATIATISDDNDYPYVLPVFYVTDESGILYFATHKDSKKLRNILSHPHIGVAITDPVNLMSLQLQGTATVVPQKYEMIQELLRAANERSENSFPPFMKIEAGSMEIAAFTVHWYRLASYSEKDAVFAEGTL